MGETLNGISCEVRRMRGIEEARAERELKESQDERATSFANSFESGELTS